MNTRTHTLSPPVRLRTLSSPLQRLRDWALTQWRGWQRARRLAQDEASFRALDGATLRDLSISASEVGSFWAESEGMEAVTRQRVLRDLTSGAMR